MVPSESPFGFQCLGRDFILEKNGKESKPKFSIRPMPEADIDETTECAFNHGDTYPNDDYGVTRVNGLNEAQSNPAFR